MLIHLQKSMQTQLRISSFSTLSSAISKVKKEHPGFKILVGADMNATIGDDSFGPWSHLGLNNDKFETNDNGNRLLHLSKENNLFIMNSFFKTKPIHRHTWYSPTGFSKRLDYILAEFHLKKLCSNYRVYRKASIPFETNHRLLTMSCSFPSIRSQKQFFSQTSKSAKPRKNISLLHDPDISGNFSNKLDFLLSDDPSTNDVNEIESILTGAILKASESEVPKIELKTRKSHWANDEFLSLLKNVELVRILLNLRSSANLLKSCVINSKMIIFWIWRRTLTLLRRHGKWKRNFDFASHIICINPLTPN